MQTLLVVGSDKKAREDVAKKILSDHSIDRLDVTVVVNEKALGIEDVRSLKKHIFLKPILGKSKAVILQDAHTATVPAQNAMLKVLEEPPENTLIILTAERKELLLPTIQSRLSLVELETEAKPVGESNTHYHTALKQILSKGVGEKLKLAQDVSKSREEALLFLKGTIIAAREKLIAKPSSHQYLILLRSLKTTHTTIATTNVSPRFALENLLLNL